MNLICHMLPYQTAEGATNMAIDEALLDAVAEGAGVAYLRTYGWTVPTLSLGYFQHLAEVRSDPRWRTAPLVRRPTGGGAIWHHHEVTYALIVPAAHPRARPNTALYGAVHAAIGESLAGAGVPALRWGQPASNDPPTRQRPFLCFTDRDSEDLVFQGFKLVGSAQRRRAGAVLQHGSLLLSRSPGAPELPGLYDLADVRRDLDFWSEQLMRCVPAALDLEPRAVDWPDAIRVRARELEASTYRTPEWTGAR